MQECQTKQLCCKDFKIRNDYLTYVAEALTYVVKGDFKGRFLL